MTKKTPEENFQRRDLMEDILQRQDNTHLHKAVTAAQKTIQQQTQTPQQPKEKSK